VRQNSVFEKAKTLLKFQGDTDLLIKVDLVFLRCNNCIVHNYELTKYKMRNKDQDKAPAEMEKHLEIRSVLSAREAGRL
jgi:hypothetical protein